jgi:hypothetical protein
MCHTRAGPEQAAAQDDPQRRAGRTAAGDRQGPLRRRGLAVSLLRHATSPTAATCHLGSCANGSLAHRNAPGRVLPRQSPQGTARSWVNTATVYEKLLQLRQAVVIGQGVAGRNSPTTPVPVPVPVTTGPAGQDARSQMAQPGSTRGNDLRTSHLTHPTGSQGSNPDHRRLRYRRRGGPGLCWPSRSIIHIQSAAAARKNFRQF